MEIINSSAFKDNLQGYWRFDGITEDSYTKCLIHFDGPDAVKATQEMSGKAVTFVGDAQLDTAQKKFGTASLLLDGTGDTVSLADSEDWNFGSGDFTIDCWIRLNAYNGSDYYTIASHYTDNNNRWHLFIDAVSNKVQLIAVTSGTTQVQPQIDWTPSTNTWYHFAFVRTGDDFKLFIDGVQTGSTVTDSGTIGNYTGALRIGAGYYNAVVGNTFNGWIDEFRISKGIARWTSNFTPPTSRYIYGGEDWSDNCYHMSAVNAPTFTTGKFGNGVDLEADSSQYFDIATALCPNLEITGSITMLAWVKAETTAGNMAIISKHDGTDARQMYLNSSNVLSTNLAGLATTATLDSDATVTDGEWAFVALIYDSTNSKYKVWVNDTKKEAAASGTTNAVTGNLSIGRFPSGTASYFDGVIDDVAVLNIALTDMQIGEIYNESMQGVILV